MRNNVYMPGESPAEINEAFKRCTAAGEVIYTIAPAADPHVVAIYNIFCREPDARPLVELALTTAAKAIVTAIALAGLNDRPADDSRWAIDSIRAGDFEPASVVALAVAMRTVGRRANAAGESERVRLAVAEAAMALLIERAAATIH